VLKERAVPSHKELPDVDWDQYRRASRRRGGVSLRTGLLFLILIMGGFVATDVISHTVGPAAQTHTLAASTPKPLAGSTAPQARRQNTSPLTAAQPTRTLAMASPTSGAGRAADLVVLGRGGSIDIVSHSPTIVHVALSDRYGHPLRPWTEFAPGHSVETELVTGRQYGYCYSQPAADGYAATQACGNLTMHQYINGARAPDGGTVQVTFTFTRKASSS
jgi:hypothetical protein